MNTNFKVVFNKARGALMVVNEVTSSIQAKGTKTVVAAAAAVVLGAASSVATAAEWVDTPASPDDTVTFTTSPVTTFEKTKTVFTGEGTLFSVTTDPKTLDGANSVWVAGSSAAVGVEVNGEGGFTNTGKIYVDNAAGTGIVAEDGAVTNNGQVVVKAGKGIATKTADQKIVTITNAAGAEVEVTGTGTAVELDAAGVTATLNNAGTIKAAEDQQAIHVGTNATNNVINNTGTITGDVLVEGTGTKVNLKTGSTLTGALEVTDATAEVTLENVTLEKTVTLAQGVKTKVQGDATTDVLDNSGEMTVEEGKTLTAAGDNQATGKITGAGTLVVAAQKTLNNAGTIGTENTGDLTVDVAGTLNNVGGTLNLKAGTNTGTIKAGTVNVVASGEYTNQKDLGTAAEGEAVALNIVAGGVLTNDGENAKVVVSGGTNEGTIAGGQVVIADGYTNAATGKLGTDAAAVTLTVDAEKTLTNNGQIAVKGGTNSGTITGGQLAVKSGTFTNDEHGSATDVKLSVARDAILNNQGNMTLVDGSSNAGTITGKLGVATGTFTNTGTVGDAETGAAVTVEAGATVNNTDGTITTAANSSNAGTIKGGTVNIHGDFQNAAALGTAETAGDAVELHVAEGKTVDNTGGTIVVKGGDNAGTIDHGAVTVKEGTFTNAATGKLGDSEGVTLTVSANATLDNQGDMKLAAGSSNAGTITGTVKLDANFTNTGNLGTEAAPADLTIVGEETTVTNTDGTITVKKGANGGIVNGGTFSVVAGATDDVFTNNKTIGSDTGNGVTLNTATGAKLKNGEQGTITAKAGTNKGSITGGMVKIDGTETFNNEGTLGADTEVATDAVVLTVTDGSTVANTDAGIITAAATSENAGTITGGTVNVKADFTNSGDLGTAEQAVILNVAATEGNLANTGTIAVKGGTNSGTITGGELAVISGEFTNAAEATIGDVAGLKLTVEAEAKLINQGTVTLANESENKGTITGKVGVVDGATVTNSGNLGTAEAPTDLTITGATTTVTNTNGTITATKGTNAGIINDGTFNLVKVGDGEDVGKFTNTGSIGANDHAVLLNTATGTTLTNDNATIVAKDGANAGTIEGGTVNLTGDYANTGALGTTDKAVTLKTAAGKILTNSGDKGITIGAGSTNEGTISGGTVKVAANGALENTGALTGVNLTVVDDSGSVTGTGAISVTGGENNGTINSTGTEDGKGFTVAAGEFTNKGTLTAKQATIAADTTLINDEAATTLTLEKADVFGTLKTAADDLTDSAINLKQDGIWDIAALNARIGENVQSENGVAISGVDLTLEGGAVKVAGAAFTGPLQVDGDASVTIKSGDYTFSTLDVSTADSAVTVDGGTLATETITTGDGTLTLKSGTLTTSLAQVANKDGTTTAPTFGTDAVTVKDGIAIAGGTLSLTDSTDYVADYYNSLFESLMGNAENGQLKLAGNLKADEDTQMKGLIVNNVIDDNAAVKSSETEAISGSEDYVKVTAEVPNNSGAKTLKVFVTDDTAGAPLSTTLHASEVIFKSDEAQQLTLVGDASGSNLVINDKDEAIAVTAGDKTTLNFGPTDAAAAATAGTLQGLSVDGTDAVVNVANTVLTVKDTVNVANGTLNVGNAGVRGVVKTQKLDIAADGILFLDPEEAATIDEASVFETNEIERLLGKVVAGRNSVFSYGASADDVKTAFNKLGQTWGAEDVNAVVYLAKPLTQLGNGFVIDGTVTDASNSGAAPNTLKIASSGLLIIDQNQASETESYVKGTVTNEGTIGVVNAKLGKIKVADDGLQKTGKVVTDSAFVSAKVLDEQYIGTDLETGKLSEAVSSMGMQATMRRADYVLSQSIADRTAFNQYLGKGTNLWANVQAEKYEADSFDNGGNFSANIGYGQFGADMAIGEKATAGVAVQYGKGKLDSDSYGIENDINNYGLALYGTFAATDTVKLLGEVSYLWGKNDITSSEKVLTQKVDTNILSAGVTAQATYTLGQFDVIPSIGLRVSRLHTDAMGLGTLSIDAQNQTLWQLPIALRVSGKLQQAAGWQFAPTAKIAVVPTFGDKEVSAIGTDVTVIDTAPVQGDFGVMARKGNLLLDAVFQLGGGKEGTSSVGGKIGVKYLF